MLARVTATVVPARARATRTETRGALHVTRAVDPSSRREFVSLIAVRRARVNVPARDGAQGDRATMKRPSTRARRFDRARET